MACCLGLARRTGHHGGKKQLVEAPPSVVAESALEGDVGGTTTVNRRVQALIRAGRVDWLLYSQCAARSEAAGYGDYLTPVIPLVARSKLLTSGRSDDDIIDYDDGDDVWAEGGAIEQLPWIVTPQDVHRLPPELASSISISPDGAMSFRAPRLTTWTPTVEVNTVLPVGSRIVNSAVTCGHPCHTVYLPNPNDAGVVHGIPECAVSPASGDHYTCCLFGESVLFLVGGGSGTVDGAARLGFVLPKHQLKTVGDEVCTFTVAGVVSAPPEYDVVSHVWSSAEDDVEPKCQPCNLWNLRDIPFNGNPAKLLALRWIYSRQERTWMDTFNIDQRDDKKKGLQVKVMDIIYSRASLGFVILECSRSLENLNRLLDSDRGQHRTSKLLGAVSGPSPSDRCEAVGNKADTSPSSWPPGEDSPWSYSILLHEIQGSASEFEGSVVDGLLDGTAYRTRVWTLQEEMLIKRKVVVFANYQNDTIHIVTSAEYKLDTSQSLHDINAKKVEECKDLHLVASVYRKANNLGYQPDIVREKTIPLLRDYRREAAFAKDHVFAVNRLLGIDISTEYDRGAVEIFREWNLKCLQAGIMLVPYAGLQAWREERRSLDCAAWRSLYCVDADGARVKAVRVKAGSVGKEAAAAAEAEAAVVRKQQSDVFFKAYNDSFIMQAEYGHASFDLHIGGDVGSEVLQLVETVSRRDGWERTPSGGGPDEVIEVVVAEHWTRARSQNAAKGADRPGKLVACLMTTAGDGGVHRVEVFAEEGLTGLIKVRPFLRRSGDGSRYCVVALASKDDDQGIDSNDADEVDSGRDGELLVKDSVGRAGQSLLDDDGIDVLKWPLPSVVRMRFGLCR
ncbi:hypothetical protein HK405_008460 [Cladochytrium tenue]|nr:hypothetical protein HK405_008460 [Cladochytrium tenue]